MSNLVFSAHQNSLDNLRRTLNGTPASPSLGRFDAFSKWIIDRLTKKKSKRKKEKETYSAQRKYEEPEGLSVNLSEQDDSFSFPSNDDFDAEQKDISNLLREWIWVKERFSVAILGEKGSGKSFLINALLEATFQDNHMTRSDSEILLRSPSSSSLEGDFFLIEENTANDSMENVKLNNSGSLLPVQEFLISDDFANSVNWSSEQAARKNLEEYFTTGRFSSMAGDRYSFLLPQGPFCGIYAKNYTISYGRVPELYVKFLSENEFRTQLWIVHNPEDLVAESDQYVQYIHREYRNLLDVPKDKPVPLSGIKTMQDLPIPISIRTLLGRSVIFRGKGTNLNTDRIFVREKLLETVTRFGFLADKIQVKLPCGLLKGNRQLTVIDSDCFDPLSKERRDKILQSVNLLLVSLDKKGIPSQIGELLRTSNFLEKYLKSNEEHKMVFLDLGEREEAVSSLSASRMMAFKSKEMLATMKASIKSQLRFLLSQSKIVVTTKSEKLLDSLILYQVKPLLFQSLNLNNGSIGRRNMTNIPSLLATITNTLLSKCAPSLKHFNKNMRTSGEKEENLLSGIQKLSKLINKKGSHLDKETKITLEALVASLDERVESLRSQLAEADRNLENVLESKAKECNGYKDVSGTSFSVFIEFVMNWWKQVLEQVTQDWKNMGEFCSQLLTDCSKTVRLTGETSDKEKTRLLHILKFCKASAERTIKTHKQQFDRKIVEMKLNDVIHTTCMAYYEILDFNGYKCPQITPQATKIIHDRMGEALHMAASHIDAIHKHTQDLMRCLVHSPFLKMSQIMTFLITNQMPLEAQQVLSLQKNSKLNNNSSNKMEIYGEPVPFNESTWRAALEGKVLDMNRYIEQLEESNLKILEFDVDGNSQFRALACQVYGIEEAHFMVRLLIMNEMLSDPTFYSKLLQGTDLEDYVYRKSKDCVEGDHVTLIAFSNFYNAEVVIYSPKLLRPMLIKPSKTDESLNSMESNINPPAEIIYLGLSGKNTYQVLSHVEPAPLLSNVDVDEELAKLDKLHLDEDGSTLDRSSNSLGPSPNRFRKLESRSNSILGLTRRKVPSLSDLCVETICAYVEFLPPLEGSLPEELVQKIISHLIRDQRLNNSILEKALDSSIISLNLGNFRRIDDFTCKIIGDICKHIKRIDLSECVDITTQGFVHIASRCNDLEEINISGCERLHNEAIEAIFKYCPRVISITISRCPHITDKGIQDLLSYSKNLQRINLSESENISDAPFQFVGENMNSFDLTNCPHLTDATLNILSKRCKRLTELKMSGNVINDSAIWNLTPNAGTLRTFEISCCDKFSDPSISSLLLHSNSLIRLSLNNCKNIGENALHPLISGRLPSLTYLDLSKSHIRENSLILVLKSLIKLTHLNISGCEQLGESSLKFLGTRDLRSIDLSNCHQVTDDIVISIAQGCQNLRKLNLQNCNQISDRSLYEIGRSCHQMEEINVSSCDKLSDEGVLQMALGCRFLKIVNIEECKISDGAIEAISRYCPDLETLAMAYCTNITDSALKFLAFSTNLKTLDISYTKSITVPVLNRLLSYLTRLENLYMRGCSSISSEGISHPSLRTLNLSWCKNLEDSAVLSIASACPSLEILHLAWCEQISTNAVHTIAKKSTYLRILNIRGCSKVSQIMMNVLSTTSAKKIIR